MGGGVLTEENQSITAQFAGARAKSVMSYVLNASSLEPGAVVPSGSEPWVTRALLVDDDRAFVDEARDYLSSKGIEIECAVCA